MENFNSELQVSSSGQITIGQAFAIRYRPFLKNKNKTFTRRFSVPAHDITHSWFTLINGNTNCGVNKHNLFLLRIFHSIHAQIKPIQPMLAL